MWYNYQLDAFKRARTVIAPLVYIGFHQYITILSSQMRVAFQHLANVLFARGHLALCAHIAILLLLLFRLEKLLILRVRPRALRLCTIKTNLDEKSENRIYTHTDNNQPTETSLPKFLCLSTIQTKGFFAVVNQESPDVTEISPNYPFSKTKMIKNVQCFWDAHKPPPSTAFL